jgi:hypothetical protein
MGQFIQHIGQRPRDIERTLRGVTALPMAVCGLSLARGGSHGAPALGLRVMLHVVSADGVHGCERFHVQNLKSRRFIRRSFGLYIDSF